MKRPEPIKGGGCVGCGEEATLLMPVPFASLAGQFVIWPCLCLQCRLDLRSDKSVAMGWEMLHSPRKDTREAYGEWLEARL